MAEDKFKKNCEITWCKGCGDFGILVALKQAFEKLGLRPSDVLVVYGIGCHGHMVNYLKTYGFEGLHGRALPVATGAKMANNKMNVVVIAGDGDQLSEGGNHLIHTARRNVNITCILHDNQVYGLTVGQTSPTSEKGFKGRSTPQGSKDDPINPLTLALSSGASFVSRSFAGDVKHLSETIVKAVSHKGFSFVDVLQPCVTFNYMNTYSWFYRRVYKLEDTKYKPDNKLKAFEKALQWGDKIPMGVFYQEERPVFEDHFPQIAKAPLAEQNINDIRISELLGEFK